MSKRKDRALILAAAESWSAELHEYIIPGSSPEEVKGYREQERRLDAAIERERSREENRQRRAEYENA